ncbi:hypothetical protein [Amycolatopsis tucumanensis]|uniref:Uncharacterized protein n=1 Tax=Amycolatopsis tucumanensis TaxID=401106 RepID=A0ABP7JWU5_9PSEU|nr:hypothetical protein [Amycolatopsis tucumanensis]
MRTANRGLAETVVVAVAGLAGLRQIDGTMRVRETWRSRCDAEPY